ncbi:MAG: alkaline phosphatase D family protein [Lewinellaceae bacterium]|nr:alkaline phosphatase D family protein [Lewinellaceae bacterium]
MKKQSSRALLDFMDVPRSAPVRKQDGNYQVFTFGMGEQRIKVIVMDTRYFRDTLLPDPTKQRRYAPNMEGDMLGEAQWKWLEKELRNTQHTSLTILCSSVQVLADEHGYEKWGNFPNARRRLLSLIAKTQPKNLMIISGDRHMAEVSKMDLQGLPYPLYDFTSSGMTPYPQRHLGGQQAAGGGYDRQAQLRRPQSALGEWRPGGAHGSAGYWQ